MRNFHTSLLSFFYKTSEKTSTEIQFQNPSALIELRDSVPISKLYSSDYKYTCKLNTNQEYEIFLDRDADNYSITKMPGTAVYFGTQIKF